MRLATVVLLASVAMAADQPKSRPMTSDVQRAIQWEKHKEEAAARQARKEARNPSVSYNNNADRSADRSAPDPGEPAVRKENKDK
jgi:hypothetical protein